MSEHGTCQSEPSQNKITCIVNQYFMIVSAYCSSFKRQFLFSNDIKRRTNDAVVHFSDFLLAELGSNIHIMTPQISYKEYLESWWDSYCKIDNLLGCLTKKFLTLSFMDLAL